MLTRKDVRRAVNVDGFPRIQSRLIIAEIALPYDCKNLVIHNSPKWEWHLSPGDRSHAQGVYECARMITEQPIHWLKWNNSIDLLDFEFKEGDVLSVSMGTFGAGFSYEHAGAKTWHYLVHQVGVRVILAAGNGYNTYDDFPDFNTETGAIVVGGSTFVNGRFVPAASSSWGSGVDCCAPSHMVNTSVGFKSGTSFAAPIVAACVAGFAEKDPTMTRSLLRHYGTDIEASRVRPYDAVGPMVNFGDAQKFTMVPFDFNGDNVTSFSDFLAWLELPTEHRRPFLEFVSHFNRVWPNDYR